MVCEYRHRIFINDFIEDDIVVEEEVVEEEEEKEEDLVPNQEKESQKNLQKTEDQEEVTVEVTEKIKSSAIVNTSQSEVANQDRSDPHQEKVGDTEDVIVSDERESKRDDVNNSDTKGKY